MARGPAPLPAGEGGTSGARVSPDSEKRRGSFPRAREQPRGSIAAAHGSRGAYNKERYGIGDELYDILFRTAEELGLLS